MLATPSIGALRVDIRSRRGSPDSRVSADRYGRLHRYRDLYLRQHGWQRLGNLACRERRGPASSDDPGHFKA